MSHSPSGLLQHDRLAFSKTAAHPPNSTQLTPSLLHSLLHSPNQLNLLLRSFTPSFTHILRKQETRTAQAREDGRLWHGDTWAQNHPCDNFVGQGVRFAAALILRNISRAKSARSVLLPHLVRHVFASKVAVAQHAHTRADTSACTLTCTCVAFCLHLPPQG